jgi:hypothetical protein
MTLGDAFNRRKKLAAEGRRIALRKRLDREHAKGAASMRTRLARLAADVAIILGEPVVTSSRSA